MSERSTSWHSILLGFVWLIAIGVIAREVAISAGWRLTRPNPLNPWESTIVADAWRTTRGIDVYNGEARTHMYGPLVTYANADVFLITGPNLLTPRLLSTIGCLGMGMLVGECALRSTSIETRRSRWAVRGIGVVGVLMECLRTRASYAEVRPDALAAFFSLATLALMFGTRWLALPMLIVAVLFKQTAGAIAFVPLLHTLFAWVFLRDRPCRRSIAFAIAAPISLAMAILLIRLAKPSM